MTAAVIKHPSDRTDALVKQLEALTNLVREGNVVDFALVAIHIDRGISPMWSETNDKWRLIGAVEAMKHSLMTAGPAPTRERA